MNVGEIVSEARSNFGETDALTLTDAQFLEWVNTALYETYTILPELELVPELGETHELTLTDGRGTLPDDVDVLVTVRVGGVPSQQMPPTAFDRMDRNPFLAPLGPVYATDGRFLWVRDSGGSLPSSVDLTIIRPPARVTEDSDEPALPKWHGVIVLFVTAFAYAQEEDKGQAQHYRNEALALLGRGAAEVPEQEALS